MVEVGLAFEERKQTVQQRFYATRALRQLDEQRVNFLRHLAAGHPEVAFPFFVWPVLRKSLCTNGGAPASKEAIEALCASAPDCLQRLPWSGIIPTWAFVDAQKRARGRAE